MLNIKNLPAKSKSPRIAPGQSQQSNLPTASTLSAGEEWKAAPQEGGMDWRDSCVLIIEDDKQAAERLALLFEHQGARVEIATGGVEGLEMLTIVSPDLILLDLLLPGKGGIELLKEIRQLSSVPIVLVTAVSQQELLINALSTGADDYIQKPFRREELLTRSWAAVSRACMKDLSAPMRIYRDGYLTVDPDDRLIMINGERVNPNLMMLWLGRVLLGKRDYKYLAFPAANKAFQ